MEFPIIINWNSPFPFQGLLGCMFRFYQNSNRTFCKKNSGDPDQTPRSAASDLGLHCLSMSHKKDARLIWVKSLHAG